MTTDLDHVRIVTLDGIGDVKIVGCDRDEVYVTSALDGRADRTITVNGIDCIYRQTWTRQNGRWVRSYVNGLIRPDRYTAATDNARRKVTDAVRGWLDDHADDPMWRTAAAREGRRRDLDTADEQCRNAEAALREARHARAEAHKRFTDACVVHESARTTAARKGPQR